MFHHTKSVIEHNDIFFKIKRYEKKLKPDYDGKVYLETAKCFFTILEEYMVKYKYVHEGKETYAFSMSDKYIMGLYMHCLLFRKEYENANIMKIELIREVLFQALQMDNILLDAKNVCVDLFSIVLII